MNQKSTVIMGNWGRQPWRVWKSHWNNRTSLGNRRLSLAIMVMFTFLAAVPYFATNRLSDLVDRRAFSPETAFDLNLPFVAWLVIPYISLYLYYPAVALLGNKSDTMWRQNIIFTQIMIITSWMAFAIFIAFPVEIDLRHLIPDLEGTGWEGWFALVHGVDKPWNAWPSLHVVQSTQIVLVLRYWYPSDTRKVWLLQATLIICWALLVISTLSIKQHYAWDAVTALIFTWVTWQYWMKPALDKAATEEYMEAFDQSMAA